MSFPEIGKTGGGEAEMGRSVLDSLGLRCLLCMSGRQPGIYM